jgi:peptide chain release factor 1
MEENLRNRLKVMRDRLTTIDDLLIQEHILNDSRQFKVISKERATLDKVVFLFNQFEANENNLSDALVMRNDTDPEIAQLGKLEVEQLTAAQEKLMEQIKFLLIPKDPNDDKNIVVEIRGAAGGDEAFIFASDLFRMYTKYCEKMVGKSKCFLMPVVNRRSRLWLKATRFIQNLSLNQEPTGFNVFPQPKPQVVFTPQPQQCW